MPSPGRSSATSRSSSSGSPKRMNRPPLQVPTAACSDCGMASTSLGRNKPDAAAQGVRPNADADLVVRVLGPLLAALLLLAFPAAAPAAGTEPTQRLIVKREPGAGAAA